MDRIKKLAIFTFFYPVHPAILLFIFLKGNEPPPGTHCTYLFLSFSRRKRRTWRPETQRMKLFIYTSSKAIVEGYCLL